MAKMPKMTDDDRAALGRLVGLYGAKLVAREASIIQNPPRNRGPRPVPADAHSVWLAIELRRDLPSGARRTVWYASGLLSEDLAKVAIDRPLKRKSLYERHGQSAAQQKADPALGELLDQELQMTREQLAAQRGAVCLPILFEFSSEGWFGEKFDIQPMIDMGNTRHSLRMIEAQTPDGDPLCALMIFLPGITREK